MPSTIGQAIDTVNLPLAPSIGAGAPGDYRDTAAAVAAFGRRVRELRESAGLSQEEPGRLSGVHRTAIDKYDTGRTDRRRTTIRRLARWLRPKVLRAPARCGESRPASVSVFAGFRPCSLVLGGH